MLSGVSFQVTTRLLTDADLAGTEKISGTRVPPEFLDGPYEELPSAIGGQKLHSSLVAAVATMPCEYIMRFETIPVSDLAL